jgi:cullin 1
VDAELASMYKLLCRVPNRIEDLYKLVEIHIRSHGGVAMARNALDLAKDPSAFVMAILEVYDRSSKLIHGAFKGDHGFATAMDKV